MIAHASCNSVMRVVQNVSGSNYAKLRSSSEKDNLYVLVEGFYIYVCLFELMLIVPVNSYGHVGALHSSGTCTKNKNVMISKKCFKYNQTAWFFLDRLRPERITSNQMVR